MDLGDERREYSEAAMDIDSVDPSPFKQFEAWFQEANDNNVIEPNAMTLATVDVAGRPTQRSVLLKYFDESGFVFFTNYLSRKSKHIDNNHHVSVLFPWFALQRQVEINGDAEKVSPSESLKYFVRRPRGSQLGAWVSNQSTVVSTRSILHNKLAELKQKFSSGSVPMPPFWGGYRIKPERFEFWQGGPNRLHDRIAYVRESGSWNRQRLAP
jgi:pyridoxamine 5'-phosphate oxidase